MSLDKRIVILYSTRTSYRRRQWHPTPVPLPGKSHGQRSLVGCSPWGREESDMAEWLHFHFSLLCTGEGNGNPLQCPCLENSRDGVAVRHDWSDLAVAEHQTPWLLAVNYPRCSAYSFRPPSDQWQQQRCRWHHPYDRKHSTKEPLDERERGEWKSWLKTQHSEN